MTVNSALQVNVQPIALESNSYSFTIHNTSQREVRNIEFSFYDLLGPGDFGLDDTHMPTSLTSEPKVVMALLQPGQSTRVELKKWGPISRYKGKANRTVSGRFADGRPMNGHTLIHEVQVTVLKEPQSA
jgi:hypothetical protein